jgi:hypothetical protein
VGSNADFFVGCDHENALKSPRVAEARYFYGELQKRNNGQNVMVRRRLIRTFIASFWIKRDSRGLRVVEDRTLTLRQAQGALIKMS